MDYTENAIENPFVRFLKHCIISQESSENAKLHHWTITNWMGYTEDSFVYTQNRRLELFNNTKWNTLEL